MKYDFLTLIDILGTVSFAVSGVFAAMQKKLDIFGILVIAFITALGGGTVRDMMIGDLPVQWMRNLNYPIIITISVFVTVVFNKIIKNLNRTNDIWQFLNRDYSMNNPFMAGAYNGTNYPTVINDAHPSQSFLNEWKLANSQIGYSCRESHW